MRYRANLGLRLNLAPVRRAPVAPSAEVETETVARVDGSPRESSEEEAWSPASSCLSTEMNEEVMSPPSPLPSPEKSPAKMVVAGCSRCLMYVMVLEDDSRCPRCRSNVLLDLNCIHLDKKKKPSK